jgi:hypothetical protein
MPSREDELWRVAKAGRLEEGEGEAHLFTGAKGQIGRSVRIPSLPSVTRRSVPSSRVEHRLGLLQWKDVKVTPFHFEFEHLSRRPAPTLPRAVAQGKRVAIWPDRAERAAVKRLSGARYHRDHRVWSLPKGHHVLGTALGELLTSRVARTAAFEGRSDGSPAATLRQAVWFVDYITRSGRFEDRQAELVHDDHGPIVGGSMGRSPAGWVAFWHTLDDFDRRVNARLQERIIIELPFWFTPAECRETLRRLGKVFDERGLAWLGAVHLPDVHGDARNIHIHLIVCPRPVVSWDLHPTMGNGVAPAIASPRFSPKKDRDAQGAEWIAYLRKTYADIVNDIARDSAERTGVAPARIFHPGSAVELAMEGRHVPPVSRADVATRRRASAQGELPPDAETSRPPNVVRFLRQLLAGLDADRTAFLDLCDRLASPSAPDGKSPVPSGAHAAVVAATDLAAEVIDAAEVVFDGILLQSDHQRRAERLDGLCSLARAVRDAVARAHLTEREYIRQLELARRAVEEQRMRAIDQAKPSAPSIAPPLPAERESPPTIDTQRVASGNPLARAITPLRKSGEPQELGPFVLAALASDIRTPRLFAWLRESVRRSDTADIVADLRRLDALSSTPGELGPAFARARAELNAAMLEDRRWRGPEPRVSSAPATPRTPPRASIEPRMSPEAETIKAGPFPNPKYAIRVADDPDHGTKRDEILPTLKRLPTDALELLNAHTRAAYDLAAAEFRRHRSDANAIRFLALNRGVELLEELAQSRGVRFGGAAMAQALPARPNRDGGRER